MQSEVERERGWVPEIIQQVEGQPRPSFMTEAMSSSPVMVYKIREGGQFYGLGPTWLDQHVRKTLCKAREARVLVRLFGRRVEEDTKTRWSSLDKSNTIGSRINTVQLEESLELALSYKLYCQKRLATCKPAKRHGLPPSAFLTSKFMFCLPSEPGLLQTGAFSFSVKDLRIPYTARRWFGNPMGAHAPIGFQHVPALKWRYK
ncbi:hypothetical protein B0T20DRAFT_150335 [Sordaria brevicollis]|uniref:Uncharacterized protein n=1 Tax=Sordaria brevicollis TaxID=83679 RepID=A0AAE0PIX6_SORBR|nr:hypothetical protein B0T20DRAFT_150335 [Sordaria brevicollis]